MKTYTDLEQSKKLAEVLPIESADMYYREVSFAVYDLVTHLPDKTSFPYPKGIEAWSLSALLKVMPSEIKDNHYLTLEKETFETGDEYCCCYEDCNGNSFKHMFADNPVDACYEMIIKLHELKML